MQIEVSHYYQFVSQEVTSTTLTPLRCSRRVASSSRNSTYDGRGRQKITIGWITTELTELKCVQKLEGGGEEFLISTTTLAVRYTIAKPSSRPVA